MPTMSKLPASNTLVLQPPNGPRRLGFWSSILLLLLAITAFALGITTPPRSGPYCTGICIVYPFTDAARFVPRDYSWIIPAILLVPVFVVVVASIHERVQPGKRHLSLVGLCFSSIAASIIAVDYFIQFQVAEPSLQRGETAGLALLTQYNPHGLFIALEDLGYLALCVAFVFVGTAFPGTRVLARVIRWTLLAAAFLGFGCFIAMTWHFGLDLEYRFEVAIITVTWTALIILGVMLALFFHLPPSEDHVSRVKPEGGPRAFD
jgi:hypothetical protein